jgi:hypothetical protein
MTNLPNAFSYEKYMIDNHGFSMMWLPGQVGYSGQKIHEFYVCAKIDGDILYLASRPFCSCGSAKWNTNNVFLFNEIDAVVNCEKCKPDLKKKKETK